MIQKAIQLSLTNLWRNKFLTLATALVIGIIIFIFNIVLSVNFIAKDSLDSLGRKVDLILYVKDSADYQTVQEIIGSLENLNNVENVTYTSKNEAIQELKTSMPDLSVAFDKYDLENPLPASIKITTSSPEYHAEVLDFIKKNNYQNALSNVSGDKLSENSILNSVNENLGKLHNFTRQILLWVILTLLLGGALITVNAIQITIFSRKMEIEVMKLVGASPWFIRLPFILEGFFYGVFAMLVSAILLFVLAENSGISSLSLFSAYSGLDFGMIILGELIFTVLLTSLSSAFAVQKHLQ